MFGGGVGFAFWSCWTSIKKRCKQKMLMDQTFSKVEKLSIWNMIVVWAFFFLLLFWVLEFWDVVFDVRKTTSMNGEKCLSMENFYDLVKLMNLCYV
jgi:hypothetical protein